MQLSTRALSRIAEQRASSTYIAMLAWPSMPMEGGSRSALARAETNHLGRLFVNSLGKGTTGLEHLLDLDARSDLVHEDLVVGVHLAREKNDLHDFRLGQPKSFKVLPLALEKRPLVRDAVTGGNGNVAKVLVLRKTTRDNLRGLFFGHLKLLNQRHPVERQAKLAVVHRGHDCPNDLLLEVRHVIKLLRQNHFLLDKSGQQRSRERLERFQQRPAGLGDKVVSGLPLGGDLGFRHDVIGRCGDGLAQVVGSRDCGGANIFFRTARVRDGLF